MLGTRTTCNRCIAGLLLLASPAYAICGFHSADTNQDNALGLGELLRLVQLYNGDELHCQTGTEDDFAPGPGDPACPPHSADYNPQDWSISLSELLRGLQMFNSLAYHPCPESEDLFCVGPQREGELEGDAKVAQADTAEGTAERISGVPIDLNEMVSVSAGSFEMGRPCTQDAGGLDAVPVHTVYLDAYEIGRYEVTNQQMADVLNWAYIQGSLADNSSGAAYTGGVVYAHGERIVDTYTSSSYSSIVFDGDEFTVQSRTGARGQIFSMSDHPVVRVSWFGAVAYCNWRSEMEELAPCYSFSDWTRYNPIRNGYRLPTEAEWEHAAAWEGNRHWRFGFASDTISRARANYYDNNVGSSGFNPLGLTKNPRTSPVGWFDGLNVSPNGNLQTQDSRSPVGCYDMSGNMWEWCHDWYDSEYYAISPGSNPLGPASGMYRVLRGGGWLNDESYTRAATRNFYTPENRDTAVHFGLRVARTP